VADDIVTPIEAEEWGVTELASLEDRARQHDHKGHSEEMCVRCGWVMGHRPLNCQNDDTPHVFPSQEAEIERLRVEINDLRLHLVALLFPKEARRG
jgi:pantothenate kinase-related protein Tda10